MSWLEAVVLGIVQGLTEFLPISSSAHQLLVARLFFGNDGGGSAFTAINQLGTEAAVLVYFRHDIVRIIKQWSLSLVGRTDRNDPDARMGWLVIIGTIPIGLLGLLFQDAIDSTLRNMWITASMLLLFALVIAVADSTAKQRKELDRLDVKTGVAFGFWQALALIPGVSRSGGTIAGGLFMGFTREAAARYSFLLAIPAVLASGLFKVATISETDPNPPWGQILVATVLAFVIGYAVIAWLMRYISTHDFKPFVIYRIVLALVIFALLAFGVVDAAAPPV
ncbi:undecaprenyl-diphosphatase [Barrientosiimonas humi]|uniref:Undecaprenyl-diphosphatase n=2 Tax=Barrientosiimonas TaxID=1535207 RepID=A0A542X9X6_9MICO|nr:MULTISPECIES: undecaprenyl-diphosphate phosphatase [Barrientosiimonas]TQL32639.1 undecaprenyl-diphosphatase [Barrientosiimonas humi]BDZ57424.1 undecaprenyl-diphosphatase [Barrientosiimonas endolithica]CAG7572630.1 Undecaprenyl-diphosphatase [Barrientosiimonas humi]